MAGTAPWTALLLSLCLLGAGAAVPAGGANAHGEEAAAFQQAVDADEVRLDIALREDGSAVWTVEYRVRLADDNETAAFESLVADVAANESAYVERFSGRIRATVADAENATGREMAARNFSVDAEIRNLPETFGVLTYRFRWEGFAAVDGDRLSTGGTLDGLFLTEGQSLEVSWPADYDLDRDPEPAPDTLKENAAVWEGPITFDDGGPRVVVTPAGGTNPVPLAGGVALLALAVVGVWAYWTRRSEPESAAESDRDQPPEPEAEEPPPELLSNEERVLALVENRGGRIKQQEVVDELDWTAAKTSQVVTDMREAGQIDVFRLGRENVIKLPDADLALDDEEREDAGSGE